MPAMPMSELANASKEMEADFAISKKTKGLDVDEITWLEFVFIKVGFSCWREMRLAKRVLNE
jgi:hypothetical protein